LPLVRRLFNNCFSFHSNLLLLHQKAACIFLECEKSWLRFVLSLLVVLFQLLLFSFQNVWRDKFDELIVEDIKDFTTYKLKFDLFTR
jgi:hypothetical protein